MKRRNYYLIALSILSLTAVLLTVWWVNWHLPPNTLKVNNQRFEILIAQTPQQQVDGLAGVTELDSNQGMLFPLNGYPSSFWMKGMVIDIDIIWIKDNKVAGINHNVLAPEPNTPDAELPSYPAPVSSPQAVLELAAGQAKAHGITIGDSVTWRED